MDTIFNSKIDNQTIYDIYRACRLCGAGAGYKMPIIQNVVDLDTNGIELKQKIRDCVQIEVHSDDKMPPLICELCVDKVNDFYEFLEMCQQTNKRTRARLGLPSQSTSKDSGDCILGVTEQVYGHDDSDEPLSSSSGRRAKPEVKIKVEKVDDTRTSRSRPESKDSKCRSDNSNNTKPRTNNGRFTKPRPENSREGRFRSENSRESRFRESRSRLSRESSGSRSRSPPPRVTRQKRPPSPPRATRQAKSGDENAVLSTIKQTKKSNSQPSPAPKSILKKDKESKNEEMNRSKRSREPVKSEVPQKKVKMAVPPSPKARPPPAPPTFAVACSICRKGYNTSQALGNHMRTHTVGYTDVKLTCNACEDWFPSPEEAASHHRWHRMQHRPYRCRRCCTKFKMQQGYDDHITNSCVPWEEVPDVKCDVCWRLYPTATLLAQHRCKGADDRPGGKCIKCKRTYALLKNLRKHEETCTSKRKSDLVVEPGVLARLLPARVRLARCDALVQAGACSVAGLAQSFGLDPSCTYPYLRRSLPTDLMVDIKTELPDLDVEDFVHWDSGDSGSDDDERTVNSLTTLALKTIFSKKFLGKVPRKRRKVKIEKSAFDTILDDNDMRKDIDNIIDNLGDDGDDDEKREVNDNDSVNSESLLCNDVPVTDETPKQGFKDNSDSQSFNDKSEVNNENEVGNTNKDKEASTDCETEAEDDAEDTAKKSSLSTVDEEVNYKIGRVSIELKDDAVSNFDNASTNSGLDDESRKSVDGDTDHHETIDRQTNTNDDESKKMVDNDHVRTEGSTIEGDTESEKVVHQGTDGHTNGDISGSSGKNDLYTDKELMDAIDEQIGESNDKSAESNEKHSSDSKSEIIDKETTVNEQIGDNNEGNTKNNDDVNIENKLSSERLKESHNNGRTVNETDLKTTNVENTEIIDTIDENRLAENHKAVENNDKDNYLDNYTTKSQYDENEAMCNDIENKINDLIAYRNQSDDNDWNNTKSVSATEINDKVSENNHVAENNDKGKVNLEDLLKEQSNVTDNNESFTQNNENAKNLDESNMNFSANNVSYPQNNTEKEKVSLEDLILPKDAETKSMDLDSISDTEFDFDA